MKNCMDGVSWPEQVKEHHLQNESDIAHGA